MPGPRAPGIRMVVGLGNPGPRYARTRHNVGFMVAAELASRFGAGEPRMKQEALVAPLTVGEVECLLVQPQTFMNLSGRPVAALAGRAGIEPGGILLVYDEADLPLGALRLRAGGSPGGHRGVLSIVECLGTRDIPRLRLGIGKDEGELADRVLAPFTRAEQPAANRMIEEAVNAVEAVLIEGLAAAMNTYNRKADPSGP